MTVHTASISIACATRYPCRSHSPVVKSACARHRPLFSLLLYNFNLQTLQFYLDAFCHCMQVYVFYEGKST